MENPVIFVYVSAPLSNGDAPDYVQNIQANIKHAIQAAESLRAVPVVRLHPVVPHLSRIWNDQYPHPLGMVDAVLLRRH